MRNASFLHRYRLSHVLFWAALFGLWYYFRYEDFSSHQLAARVTLLKVLDLALMVYVTNYLFIPTLLYRKHYLAFGLAFTALVLGGSMGKMWIEGQLMHRPALFTLFDRYFKARFYDNVIPHFLLVSTGAAFKLLLDYARVQRRLGEMAREKAEAELNFLKSQINPHFLFNSLNSVYFLIDKHNDQARRALHKFSDMLRYQLYECNDDKIPIEKEIGYIRDYVDLQKLRHGEQHEVELVCGPELGGFMIEPLLLMPFVENSFKHLSHFGHGRKNLVFIKAEKKGDEFFFSVQNTTEGKSNSGGPSRPGGIGLRNVTRRLELLYDGKHELSISTSNDRFLVNLKISLT
jgi:two-component system, LytTR family, sensor kinase